jgi:putative transposase
VDEHKKHGIEISMTEENHCSENAIAERVNGILKDDFSLDQCFCRLSHASKATKNAIEVQNSKKITFIFIL